MYMSPYNFHTLAGVCCRVSHRQTQPWLIFSAHPPQIPFVGEGMKAADRQMLITTNVLPHVIELCSDSSQHVRAAMASVLSELAPICECAARLLARPMSPFHRARTVVGDDGA